MLFLSPLHPPGKSSLTQPSGLEIPFINTRPADANGFKSYGLRMIVIKHYMLVRGIRSRVREDMDSFVEFYEHTILPTGAAGSSNDDKRAKFYEYYGLLRSHDGDKTHTQDTAMYLEQLGADIARRMLIMGTHLVELVCALHALDGIKRASIPSTDESGH